MSSTAGSGPTGVTRVLTGRCECGAVEYTVPDDFAYSITCHCSNCRAHTGSAFKAFAGIAGEKLTIAKGADGLLVWGDPDGKNHTRCGTCGSPLYSVVNEEGWVHVALGSLRDAPSIRPAKHIFVGSKAPWFDITDDLPRFEELR